jgi:single-stranded-DNA-specific exonuclease
LVLSSVAALRRELNVALDVRRWMDLVAIGTIADVAPLDGDNRALVRAGLLALAQTQRPGLAALLEQLGVSREGPLTARDVAFRVAPQINAPGRLGSPMLALELLLSSDEVSAKALAQELSQVTGQRKEQQEVILDEAVKEIEEHGYAAEPAIVVGRPGWNPGVVGIVAGRLAERYGRPVVVIGFEASTGRGSVRGPRGSRLHDALSASAECLVRFGGHQAAAGLELQLQHLPEFRSAFCRSVAALPLTVETARVLPPLQLFEGDTPSQLMTDLDRLEPCGPDNPRPKLSIEGLVVEAREVGAGHLKLRLDVAGSRLDCFGVNLGHKARALNGRVRALGDLRRSSFRGKTTIELFVEELSTDETAGGAA